MSAVPRVETLRLLEREVGVLIRRVRRVIHERARSVHPDLQPASYLLLAHLAEAGPMRSSAVAEVFGIDKGAISRQVQHLVDLDLIARAPDPADGRATLLRVTDDARARLGEMTRHRRQHLDERLGDWSEEDLTRLVSSLARYNDSLE
jgi:DNA-binding MarR family transcriptional regulator